MGFSVEALDGSDLDIRGSVLAGGHGASLVSIGCSVSMQDSIVRDIEASEEGLGGNGVLAFEDTSLTMRRTLVSGCRFGAVELDASTALLDGVAVLGTVPDASGEASGVVAYDGADLTLLASLIAESVETGILAAGSTVRVEKSVVRDTSLHASGHMGYGVELEYGASGRVAECAISGNRDAGIACFGSDLVLERSVVRDTGKNATLNQGFGVAVVYDCVATLLGAALVRNQTGGLEVAGLGSSVIVDRSLVADAGPGGIEGMESPFGDGLLAAEDAVMAVSGSLVRGNARAGVFYDHASGSVAGTTLRDGKWALVLQGAKVDWETLGNDLSCNVYPGASAPGLTPPPGPDLPPPSSVRRPE